MSFRELRNFTEILRQLGFPRLLSLENFRKPNFELVADILYWMVKLYDPDTTISDRVEFENERIEFLTQIAALMAAKARIKLNTKKLYASDGRAVQELLKIAVVLNKAMQSASTRPDDNIVPPIKVQDIKAARQLASEITQSGAKLFDMLAKEASERQERLLAIRFLDQSSAAGSDGSREQAFIERSVKELIDATKQHVEDMRKECDELEVDERNLESKIRKKQEELERTEKRLRSIESVRPQFLEEAERLELELQRHYEMYMERYRNVDYLEHELGKYAVAEEERREEQQRKVVRIREKLLRDEVEILRGNREGDEGSARRSTPGLVKEKIPSTKPQGDYGSRKQTTTAAVARAQMAAAGSRSRATGNIGGGESEEESSDDEDTDRSGDESEGDDDEEEDQRAGTGRRGGSGAASDEGSDLMEDDADDGDDSGSDEHF